jgi:hypothetical protein
MKETADGDRCGGRPSRGGSSGAGGETTDKDAGSMVREPSRRWCR